MTLPVVGYWQDDTGLPEGTIVAVRHPLCSEDLYRPEVIRDGAPRLMSREDLPPDYTPGWKSLKDLSRWFNRG